MTKRCLMTVYFALLAVSAGLAQEAPATKTADNGPSLEVTMKFIQEKLNDVGLVKAVESYENTANNGAFNGSFTLEVSNVVADQNQCRISYHWKGTENGVPMEDQDVRIQLHDVEDIVTEPYPQYRTELWSRLNPDFITAAVSPTLTAFLVRRPHSKSNPFAFADPDLANRVAMAMIHAVELCGGGK